MKSQAEANFQVNFPNSRWMGTGEFGHTHTHTLSHTHTSGLRLQLIQSCIHCCGSLANNGPCWRRTGDTGEMEAGGGKQIRGIQPFIKP